MEQLSQNLPGIIALASLAGIGAFTGIRVGPRFLMRRIAGIIFVFFGVTFITFILGYFAPGLPFSSTGDRRARSPEFHQGSANTIMTICMGVTSRGMCSTHTS